MLTVQHCERICIAYEVDRMSGQIEWECGYGCWTVRKALEQSAPMTTRRVAWGSRAGDAAAKILEIVSRYSWWASERRASSLPGKGEGWVAFHARARSCHCQRRLASPQVRLDSGQRWLPRANTEAPTAGNAQSG